MRQLWSRVQLLPRLRAWPAFTAANCSAGGSSSAAALRTCANSGGFQSGSDCDRARDSCSSLTEPFAGARRHGGDRVCDGPPDADQRAGRCRDGVGADQGAGAEQAATMISFPSGARVWLAARSARSAATSRCRPSRNERSYRSQGLWRARAAVGQLRKIGEDITETLELILSSETKCNTPADLISAG